MYYNHSKLKAHLILKVKEICTPKTNMYSLNKFDLSFTAVKTNDLKKGEHTY